MKVGIVGFRGSGKTTVFNALTGLKAEVGGYSDRDAKNLGNIKVPDKRLKAIADKVQPKKLTYAEIVFVDLGAAAKEGGQGFSAQMLGEMRTAEALVHVARGFENPSLAEGADAFGDVQAFESELCLADLIVVENRLARIKKQNQKTKEREYLEKIQSHLEEDMPLRTLSLPDEAWASLAGFGFLSLKPCMILLNVAEEEAASPIAGEIAEYAEAHKAGVMAVSGQVEMEVNDLSEEEAGEYLESLGLEEAAKYRFIREVYGMLDLIAFFTAGEDEVRAWTIKKGTKAQKAAGKIHSDIERGFIRAEVMQWEDMAELGSDSKCREAGKMRLEGKEYLPADGEVIHFRFNV